MAYSTPNTTAKSGPLGRLPEMTEVERQYGIYSTSTPDVHAVSYASGGSTLRVYEPTNLDAGTARIVDGLRSLFRARTMEEHCNTMGLFHRDLVWDAPPILLGRKGHLRVAAYLSKFVADLEFVPDVVKVHALPGGRHVVEMIGTYALYPKRTWLVWPTLLAPRVIPIKATIKAGIDGPLENGQIELLWGRVHNAPVLPNIVRAANGVAMGIVPHVFEPVWGWGAELWGDNFYSKKMHRQWKARHPESHGLYDRGVDTVSDVAENSIDYAADVLKSVQAYVYYAIDSAMGLVRYAADTSAKAAGTAVGVASAAAQGAANVAGSAVNTAANVAGGAVNVALKTTGAVYGTAANVAGTVYDTAAPVAASAADAATNVAYQAKDTAVGVAQGAYDTAANTATRAYDTAANVAQQAKDTATYAADKAYLATQGAYDTAANTATRAYDTTADTAAQTKAAAANGLNAVAGAAAGAVQGAKVGGNAASRLPYTDVSAAADVGAAQVGKGTSSVEASRLVGQNRRY